MAIRKLTRQDQAALTRHLQGLTGEDRRLRFAATVNDDYIADYVNGAFAPDSEWLGVDGEAGELIASCHVAIHAGEAELGCSVDPAHRGKKLAQGLFNRAITYLRAKGIRQVFMNCLTENQVMKHIAKKNDMAVVSCCGDSDARLTIEPPTPVTPLHDAYLDRMALCDSLIKGQFKLVRDLFQVK
jgi:RimJ/RimL family protein N-acetyltransferase